MKQELTAQQEDFILEQARERDFELKISNCCGVNMDNEEISVCPKCKEPCGMEVQEQEQEQENYCDNPYCLKHNCGENH